METVGNIPFGNVSHEQPEQPIWLRNDSNWIGTSGAILISVTLTFGAGGNGLVLLAIACYPKLRRPDNAFIASLALTDMLFNVVIMPFYVDTYVNQNWRFSYQLCKFETFFGTILVMSSAIHIGFIAMNRYFHVVHPTTIHLKASSSKGLWLQIAFIWAICLLTILPGAFGWQADVGYSHQIGRCNYIRSTSKGSLTLIFLIGFILPCMMMVPFYVLIMKKLEESKLRLHSYRNDGSPCKHHSKKRYGKHDPELIKMGEFSRSTSQDQSDLPKDAISSLKKDGQTVGTAVVSEKNTTVKPATCGRCALSRLRRLDHVKYSLENGGKPTFDQDVPSIQSEKTAEQHSPSNLSGGVNITTHNHLDAQRWQSHDIKISSSASSVAAPGDENITERGQQSTSNIGDGEMQAGTHRASSHRHHSHNHRHAKAIKMIMVIFLAFVLTYLPFTIINLVDGGSKLSREWYMISSLAFWAGACVNPLIYGLMNGQFRQAYSIICCPHKGNRGVLERS